LGSRVGFSFAFHQQALALIRTRNAKVVKLIFNCSEHDLSVPQDLNFGKTLALLEFASFSCANLWHL
jgi:hypothetical protein